MSRDLVIQTKNAFDFVQKFYFEISYLIKEVETSLQQEEEEFRILHASGYSITTRTSTGLEPVNVERWFPTTFTVFFCRDDHTELKAGQTITKQRPDLKVLFLHIEAIGKQLKEPRALAGCLYDIKWDTKKVSKFENFLGRFSYHPQKVFLHMPDIEYSDNACSFKGKLVNKKLFSIKNSEDVRRQLVEPMIAIYRKLNSGG